MNVTAFNDGTTKGAAKGQKQVKRNIVLYLDKFRVEECIKLKIFYEKS